jgi:hypothetical protein
MKSVHPVEDAWCAQHWVSWQATVEQVRAPSPRVTCYVHALRLVITGPSTEAVMEKECTVQSRCADMCALAGVFKNSAPLLIQQRMTENIR